MLNPAGRATRARFSLPGDTVGFRPRAGSGVTLSIDEGWVEVRAAPVSYAIFQM